MTDATNPDETSSNMQPGSLPTRWYTLTRCHVTSSSIRKSVHLLFRQTGMYLNMRQLFFSNLSSEKWRLWGWLILYSGTYSNHIC